MTRCHCRSGYLKCKNVNWVIRLYLVVDASLTYEPRVGCCSRALIYRTEAYFFPRYLPLQASKTASRVTRSIIMAAPNTGQHECKLFSLPSEIRNMIYELVLTIPVNKIGLVNFGKRPRCGNNVETYSVQALLRTCVQIRSEAPTMFYSVDSLAIGYLQVKAFVSATSTSRLASIKHLAIKGTRGVIVSDVIDHNSNNKQIGTMMWADSHSSSICEGSNASKLLRSSCGPSTQRAPSKEMSALRQT